MTRNRSVPIVNNAPEPVTFVRQIAGSVDRGTITVKPGKTHYEPGPNLTYETLVLKDPNGKDQVISMDELCDDLLEKIEVNRDFQLVRHQRRTTSQKISDFAQKFFDWIPGRSRSGGETSLESLPTHNNNGHA